MPVKVLSSSQSNTINTNGLLHSPQLGSTGVTGTCLSFKYAIDGLSPAGLRLFLHNGKDEFSSTITKENLTSPGTMSCDRPSGILTSTPVTTIQQEERILWHANYHVLGVWQQAQILYTFPDPHSVCKK